MFERKPKEQPYFKAEKVLEAKNIEAYEFRNDAGSPAILAINLKQSSEKNVSGQASIEPSSLGAGGGISNKEETKWVLFANPANLGGLEPLENFQQPIKRALMEASGATIIENIQYQRLNSGEIKNIGSAQVGSTLDGRLTLTTVAEVGNPTKPIAYLSPKDIEKNTKRA